VKGHVLVVDGDQISRLMLRHMLTELGFETSEAYNVASAVASVIRRRPNVVISDLELPDGTALDVLDSLLTLPDAPGLVLITDVSEDDPVHPRFQDVPPRLTKPVSTTELKNSLQAMAGGRS
jgi:two-component system response regulator AtoC